MKKYLIKIVLLALVVTGIIVSINVIIDPYNVFHYENPVDNGIEANKNFIKTKYLLKNQEPFNSLVFGSSRAGFVDVEDLTDGNYYNMCSSEAVPAEHLRTLKTLIQGGFVPKNVLILIDDISCFVDPASHQEMLYRIPYPDGGVLGTVKFYAKYCDLITTFEALEVINHYENKDPDYTRRFRENGSERLDYTSNFDGTGENGFWCDYYSLRLQDSIAEIEAIIALCEEYGINLRIVTNPLYHKTYALAVQNGYLDFLEALAEVTEFYNFSSFSEITLLDANYYEASHFTAQTTELMMKVVYDGWCEKELVSQGFGVKVTNENKEEVLGLLRSQAKERGISGVE